MDQNHVREHLAQLHAQLSDLEQKAGPETKQRLSDTARDLNRLIDAHSGTSSARDESLPDRLEKIAVQFEADHPTLAASARRLVDLLGEVGI